MDKAYNQKLEGIKVLAELKKEDRKNPVKLLEVEKKYHLGYNIVAEFCDEILLSKMLIT